jgi:hypothetical protein
MNSAFQRTVSSLIARLWPEPLPKDAAEGIDEYNAAGKCLYQAPITTTGNKVVVVVDGQEIHIEIDDVAGDPTNPLYVRVRKCLQCGTKFVLLLKPGEERTNTQRFCKTRGDKCREEYKAQRRKERDSTIA